MEKKGKNRSKIKKVFVIILLLLVLWTLWSGVPVTERITLDIPECSGDGVRIALVTDLHSCYYGKDQKLLTARTDKEEPDVILLGGDIFDDIIDDKNAKILIEKLVKTYPCYYVTGNHEYWSHRAGEMKKYMESVGVHVLAGDCDTVTVNGNVLDICGVDDPDDLTDSQWRHQIDMAHAATDDTHVRILLTHRPERVKVYEQYDFDLIVAGHAHAGQIRIPFINKGVFAPDQGFMAEYVNGEYTLSNGSIMVVSRGLARESTLAPRFFNHPELVIIDLK